MSDTLKKLLSNLTVLESGFDQTGAYAVDQMRANPGSVVQLLTDGFAALNNPDFLLTCSRETRGMIAAMAFKQVVSLVREFAEREAEARA